MREIPVTTSKGTFYLHLADNRLGSLDYWRENFRKSTKEDVETYLGRQSWDQQADIMTLAKEFHNEEKPLAPMVSLIPVAAHQESQRIMPAMAEFAKQQSDNPLSILLYLNVPGNAEHQDFTSTMNAIALAKKTYPELDIRASGIYEHPEPRIGRIRKDLWDAAVYLAYYEGLFENQGEVLAFNHDIDIEWIGRGFLRSVRQYYDKRIHNAHWAGTDQLRIAGTQIRHAYDPDRPNVSRVVRWHDLSCWIRSPQATFEAGLVVPLSSYVRAGGFNDSDQTHETARLTLASDLAPRIRHSPIATSPRRFGDRLHVADLGAVWSAQTFGANDACRAEVRAGDISDKRAYDVLRRSLLETIPHFFNYPIYEYLHNYNKDGIETKLHKRKLLATTVLRRLDPSGCLADTVDKKCDINEMLDDLKQGNYPTRLRRT